jgi:hypothetical protein
VNEQDNDRQDRNRSCDNRVFWSDLNGFADVRVDARHDHKIRGKSEAVKWVLVALTAILIAEILWLTWPVERKSLLIRPYPDTERTDAR